jgi:hypothetical protein
MIKNISVIITILLAVSFDVRGQEQLNAGNSWVYKNIEGKWSLGKGDSTWHFKSIYILNSIKSNDSTIFTAIIKNSTATFSGNWPYAGSSGFIDTHTVFLPDTIDTITYIAYMDSCIRICKLTKRQTCNSGDSIKIGELLDGSCEGKVWLIDTIGFYAINGKRKMVVRVGPAALFIQGVGLLSDEYWGAATGQRYGHSYRLLRYNDMPVDSFKYTAGLRQNLHNNNERSSVKLIIKRDSKNLIVTFSSLRVAPCTFIILDSRGRCIQRNEIHPISGKSQYSIPLRAMPNGIVFVVIQDKNGNHARTLPLVRVNSLSGS